jgi:hypothetical protein
MNINKNNYEAFFLDYYEGKLSPNEVAELLLFIEQHPEVKEEFESFENITLEDFSIAFENKADLKKEITLTNKDEYFIKAVEGTITETEKELLHHFLKQHPQLFYEFELYKKTKLHPELELVFDEKDTIKHFYSDVDELLIASIENQLSIPELNLLQQQLQADTALKKEFNLYQQTKLLADTTIVFENKESLKRRAGFVVPLFVRYASAAAILLLFGLFFLLNNKSVNEKQFAKNEAEKENKKNNVTTPVQENKALPFSKNENSSAANVNKNEILPQQKEKTHSEEKVMPAMEINNQFALIENKKESTNVPQEQIKEIVVKQEQAANLIADNAALPKAITSESKDFLSLKEMLVTKVKEKAMDEEAIENQKKSGRWKKFNLWDAAQIVANGISRITGKEVLKVEPQYNEQGDVTAYALGTRGLEISKGK